MNVAERVHCTAGAGGGLVLLDARTGRWYVLNAVAADLWRSWAQGRDLDATVAAVAARHAGVPRTRIHADAGALLAELTRLGLIRPETAPPPRPAAPCDTGPASPAARAAARTTGRTTGRHVALGLAAVAALVIATIMVRLPFGPMARAVQETRRWCRTPETVARAESLGAAVRRAAVWFPGRTACMEVSLATVLLAAARRRRLSWCLGALPDPYRFHAWVEVDGRRIRPPDDADPGDYVPVLTI